MLEDKYLSNEEIEMVDKALDEGFDKHYESFEEFKADIAKHVEIAEQEITEGKVTSMEDVIAEMEAKYRINEII